jgi:hypothetical protein
MQTIWQDDPRHALRMKERGAVAAYFPAQQAASGSHGGAAL